MINSFLIMWFDNTCTYLLTDLSLYIYCCTGSGGKHRANSMWLPDLVLHLLAPFWDKECEKIFWWQAVNLSLCIHQSLKLLLNITLPCHPTRSTVHSAWICATLSYDEHYIIHATLDKLHPLRSLVTSVLDHFGPFLKVRSGQGPKWPRTELP